MISTKNFEDSIIVLLKARYPGADIFRRNATQSREDVETFVVTVDLQAQTHTRDYQRKDVEIVIQYFVNDKIEFNKSYNDVRDTLTSDIFINSIPIIDPSGKVIKHLLIKDSNAVIVDDILSLRLVSDFIDDTIRNTDPISNTMGSLHL